MSVTWWTGAISSVGGEEITCVVSQNSQSYPASWTLTCIGKTKLEIVLPEASEEDIKVAIRKLALPGVSFRVVSKFRDQIVKVARIRALRKRVVRQVALGEHAFTVGPGRIPADSSKRKCSRCGVIVSRHK